MKIIELLFFSSTPQQNPYLIHTNNHFSLRKHRLFYCVVNFFSTTVFSANERFTGLSLLFGQEKPLLISFAFKSNYVCAFGEFNQCWYLAFISSGAAKNCYSSPPTFLCGLSEVDKISEGIHTDSCFKHFYCIYAPQTMRC